MARPKKKGLSYFSFDVDIFEDDKIFDIQNEYGPLGEVIYIRLLCLVYKNGYYYRFENLDKLASMLIKSIGNRWARDKRTVKEVILYCAKCNLFSLELMHNNVITSRGIQARYLKANERNLSKIEEYNLLDNDDNQEDMGSVSKKQENVTETLENVAEIPRKESKRKETKVNESVAATPPAAPISKKQALISVYGKKNVSEYERRFEDWKAKKGGNIRINKYDTIHKWMEQDGVTKPQNTSSFDNSEVMDKIVNRYRVDKSNER